MRPVFVKMWTHIRPVKGTLPLVDVLLYSIIVGELDQKGCSQISNHVVPVKMSYTRWQHKATVVRHELDSAMCAEE